MNNTVKTLGFLALVTIFYVVARSVGVKNAKIKTKTK